MGFFGCEALNHDRCSEFEWTCLCDPVLFQKRILEVGDFSPKLREHLTESARLPTYVPMIYHKYRRRLPLRFPWVAASLDVIFGTTRDGRMTPTCDDARGLRKLLKVTGETKVIVTGVGQDQVIEDFWGSHRKDGLLEFLAALNPDLFTIPNFSFAADAPPLHHRYNRARMLRLAERAAKAGLTIALHLYACEEAEWSDWESILKEHTEISSVCLEFQTGYLKPKLGNFAFERLVKLQQNLGRGIHPIFVGGARYAKRLGDEFTSSTIVDSQPFMNTLHRKVCVVDHRGRIVWRKHVTPRGHPLDERLNDNLETYERRLCELMGKIQRPQQSELPFMRTSLTYDSPVSDLPLFQLNKMQIVPNDLPKR